MNGQALTSTRISNAVVEGGGNSNEGGVVVNGGAPVLQSVTLRKNRSSGVRVNGGAPVMDRVTADGNEYGAVSVYGGTPTVRDSVLRGTTGGDALGLDVHGGTVTVRDTTIVGNAGAAMALYAGAVLEGLTGLTVTGNGADVVRYRSSSIASSETWKSFGLPYVVDSWVTVSGAGSPILTIEPGVEVRFNNGQGMTIGEVSPGGLIAVGTVEQPIRFTSNAATVTTGYWRGLYVNGQALTSTRISNAVVEGGGNSNEGGVVVNGGAPVLQSVTLRKNRSSGVRVNGGAPAMDRVTADGNEYGAVSVYGGTPTVRDSVLRGHDGRRCPRPRRARRDGDGAGHDDRGERGRGDGAVRGSGPRGAHRPDGHGQRRGRRAVPELVDRIERDVEELRAAVRGGQLGDGVRCRLPDPDDRAGR